MKTRIQNLTKALDLLRDGYRRMNDDLESGADPSVVKQRQNALYDEIMEEIEQLREIVEPDIVIVLQDGQVQNVYGSHAELKYVIADTEVPFDPETAEVYEAEAFTNYKGLVKELNAEFVETI